VPISIWAAVSELTFDTDASRFRHSHKSLFILNEANLAHDILPLLS
jgi:hypothetical protein